jgi:hypothetical protein
VTASIAQVQGASGEADAAAAAVLSAGAKLADNAGALRGAIQGFLTEVRAA